MHVGLKGIDYFITCSISFWYTSLALATAARLLASAVAYKYNRLTLEHDAKGLTENNIVSLVILYLLAAWT